jgi:hypothetical protein
MSKIAVFPGHKNSQAAGALLGLLLLQCPATLLAQRGPGGARVGGGTVATGMDNNGQPTGLNVKDDLRSFHDVLAVQATKEQAAAYTVMMKNTSAADADVKTLQEQLQKQNGPSALAAADKQVQDALEGARSLNKKFLESFSEPQKTGLREVTKRLLKSDSELFQQAKVLDQALETKASPAQTLVSVETLEKALTNFQRAQLDLGEEMSILSAGNGQGFSYNLPPVKYSINIGDQPLTVTTAGIISKTAPDGNQNVFAVELSEDLSDLQLNISDVLRLALDRSDRCGERVAISTAELTPRAPATLVVAQLHYERWTCSAMFGRDSMNEIVEGSGTIEVQLTPSVAKDGTLELTAQIGRIDAQGLIGDLLRSGSLGETMRDKIAQIFVRVMRQGGDFKAALPEGARAYAALRGAEFQGTGSGKLMVQLHGDIRVSNEQLAALTSELEHATQQTVPGPLLTRPATPQETVSR